MNGLFPCDHEQCNRSALDCDRFLQLVLSGRPCFESSLADLEELSQELERCLLGAKAVQASPAAPQRACTHPDQTKICYLPTCPSRNDRISCGECALRLHTSCASQGFLAETARHSETFPLHRVGRPSVALLRRVDEEWHAIRSRLRDFLVAVEEKYLGNQLFSKEFDLQTLVDRLDHFEVRKTGDDFEFQYRNSNLAATFFQQSIPKALDELFCKVQGLETSFRAKVSAAFVLGDATHVQQNCDLIRGLKEETLAIGDRLRNAQEGLRAEERRLDQFQKRIDEFWGVSQCSSTPLQWISEGLEAEELPAIELILRETWKAQNTGGSFRVTEVEREMRSVRPSRWTCEVHQKCPWPSQDLLSWVLVRLPDQYVFLYADSLKEASASVVE